MCYFRLAVVLPKVSDALIHAVPAEAVKLLPPSPESDKEPQPNTTPVGVDDSIDDSKLVPATKIAPANPLPRESKMKYWMPPAEQNISNNEWRKTIPQWIAKHHLPYQPFAWLDYANIATRPKDFKGDSEQSFEQIPVVTLRGKDLNHARLNNAFLARADLSSAQLTGAQLTNADLRNANLREAFLVADLEAARMDYAHMAGAHMEGAYLEDAQLNYAAVYAEESKTIKKTYCCVEVYE